MIEYLYSNSLKGERIKNSVKDIEGELNSRVAPTGDIVDLLQNLEIVEKRPTNAFIKKKEAEKGTNFYSRPNYTIL